MSKFNTDALVFSIGDVLVACRARLIAKPSEKRLKVSTRTSSRGIPIN